MKELAWAAESECAFLKKSLQLFFSTVELMCSGIGCHDFWKKEKADTRVAELGCWLCFAQLSMLSFMRHCYACVYVNSCQRMVLSKSFSWQGSAAAKLRFVGQRTLTTAGAFGVFMSIAGVIQCLR